VIRRHVFVKIKGIKQPLLVIALLSHHAGALPPAGLKTKTLKRQQRSVVFQQNRPRAVIHLDFLDFRFADGRRT
jgi:hypothetical protein